MSGETLLCQGSRVGVSPEAALSNTPGKQVTPEQTHTAWIAKCPSGEGRGGFLQTVGLRSGGASCSPAHRPHALKHIPHHTESGSPHRFCMAAAGFCCLSPKKHLAMPAEDCQLCITPQENLPAPAKDLTYWFTLDFSFSPHFHAVPPLSQISR